MDRLQRWSQEAPALACAATGVERSYGELSAQVAAVSAFLGGIAPRTLVYLSMPPRAPAVVLYLACLRARHPALLLDPADFEKRARLFDAYPPGLVCMGENEGSILSDFESVPLPGSIAGLLGGFRLFRPCGGHRGRSEFPLHPELALLLTTSGSTGSPKLVRLSYGNLDSNARSIVAALGIESSQRAIQSLPLSYSYGLSVVNSHLQAGASVVLSGHSFLGKPFWRDFDANGCTSFAGVPFMYDALERLRFRAGDHPRLRAMTQAGGALGIRAKQYFFEEMASVGGAFFVMYGQTEATARIAYVPPARLPDKWDAIGIPIPEGTLELGAAEEGCPAQELVYRGPNVMQGYADSASCLARGDDLQGVLRTGDLGWRDAEGFYYLTGRLARIAKVYGRRVSLDELERQVETAFAVSAACFSSREGLSLYCAETAPHPSRPAEELCQRIALWTAKLLGVPPRAIAVASIESLPTTASGKKDYHELALSVERGRPP